MKKIFKLFTAVAVSAFFTALFFTSCKDDKYAEETEFTGNEASYTLFQGSDLNTHGTVTFKEKVDGFTQVVVDLEGTEGDITHPVHLHLGDISLPDADIAALLTPLNASTGASITNLRTLSDETAITYKDILEMEASVKIHLEESGPGRDIILAAGNIGSIGDQLKNGRLKVAVCDSEIQ